MPTWPLTLPQRQFAGSLSVATEDNRLVFKPDIGRPIVRRRYTGDLRTLNLSLVIEQPGLLALEAFYHVTLQEGALSFEWSGLYEPGSDTYLFAEPPSIEDAGAPDVWRVGLVLWQVP